MLYLDPYALTPWLVQLQHSESINPGGAVLLNRLLIVSISALLFWRAWATGLKVQSAPAATRQLNVATAVSRKRSVSHWPTPAVG